MFSYEELSTYRMECAEIDYYDENGNRLDLLILGVLRAITKTQDTVHHARSTQQVRKRKKMMYILRGEKVCEVMFLFAYGIGQHGHRWKRLLKLFAGEGVVMKSHGNSKRVPRHSLSLESRKHVTTFIRNYAEEAALFLPGRQANQRQIVKLLPSNETKKHVFERYEEACRNSKVKPVKLTTFRLVWNDFCPDIVIQRPQTDLCADCQASYVSHEKLKGKSEAEKATFFEQCQAHLTRVDVERRHYFNVIKNTRTQLLDGKKETILKNAESGLHCIFEGTVHYSFDYAQQIHVPTLPQQPGPIYFLTPYKIGLFGVMNDTFNHQGNYIIPESVAAGKGANSVISYLHDFIERDGIGETEVSFHADNCCAQNKNHSMIYYLLFRVLLGLNQKITLNFLPVGHTKFSVDWAFGLIKKRLRVEETHDINDVSDVIQQSTKMSGVNIPIITGTELGKPLVDVFDWSTFFMKKKWKRIPGITKYFHFTIDKNYPGTVVCQASLDTAGTRIQIVNLTPGKRIIFRTWPEKIAPEGISPTRYQYLKSNIVKYCRPESSLASSFV